MTWTTRRETNKGPRTSFHYAAALVSTRDPEPAVVQSWLRTTWTPCRRRSAPIARVLREGPASPWQRRSVGDAVGVTEGAGILRVVDHAKAARKVRFNAWLHVALLGLVGFLWHRVGGPPQPPEGPPDASS